MNDSAEISEPAVSGWASLHDELAQLLAELGHDDEYFVLSVLKVSDAETTELVAPTGGRGATSSVHDDRRYVRKRIDERSGLGGAYERLLVAQEAGRTFEHLPRIVSCARAAGRLDVVMEYVEGETLAEYVGEQGSSEELARQLFPLLCDAVAELHEGFAVPGAKGEPVIHRDLKPSNVMVGKTDDGAPTLKIIDLGIARTWHADAESDTVHLGTRAYAPPEQYGFGQTGVRSDVYALGGLLYFCVTGADPKPGANVAEQIARAGISKKLGRVIRRAMAFDPKDRYASAKDLGRAAVAVLGTASGVDAPSTPIGALAQGASCGLGRAWNLFLLAGAALVAAGGEFAVFEPTGQNVNLPTWLLAAEYFGMLDVWLVAITYVLMDKRRLRRRFPAFEHLRGKRLAAWAAALIAVPFLLVMLLLLLYDYGVL